MLRSGVQLIKDADGNLSLACGGTNGEASEIFELSNVKKIGLELLAASSGDVDVIVELEVSNSTDATTFDEETGYSDLVNLTAETMYRKTITFDNIPGHRYGRIKATGQNANHATTVVSGSLNLIRDEE